MADLELAGLALVDTVRGLRTKTFSSVELLEAVQAQREKVEPKLSAYLSNDDVAAKKVAADIDASRAKGEKLPLLAGVPIAIKDNFNVTGTETTAGSQILREYVSPYDATAVRKLREAGAVFCGKTNMDEFAMGSSTEHSAFQITKNPWDIERVPGGSSGGSAAAVSADTCMAALGSDTGGSVRQPAAFTGTVGLKPTYGRISRYGLIALASSLDVVGTITKTVEDAALLLETLAGEDEKDATCYTEYPPTYSELLREPDLIKGLKIGMPEEYFGEGVDPKVEKLVRAGIAELEKLGASVEPVSLPHSKYALPAYYIIMPAEASANLARYDGIRYGASVMRADDVDVANLLEVYTQSRSRGFGSEPLRRIMLGTYSLSEGYSDEFYRKAQKVRTLVRQDFLDAFKKVDVLITPTAPTTAFKIGEKTRDPLAMYKQDIFSVAANVAGVPALSLSCGLVDGLPVGMQIITTDFNEEKLLKVGHAYQQVTDWHAKKPKL